MLLPLDRIAYEVAGDRVLPSWLRDEDQPFVSAVLAAVAALSGLSVRESEIAAAACLGRLAREARLPVRVAEALWAIERKRWESRVEAPVDPEALRDVLFELSARLSREQAVAEAARRLEVPSHVVIHSLFADRASRRVLLAPPGRVSPLDLVARYNLALAQSFLARSMDVQATIGGDRSHVVTVAKRDGLLARFEDLGETTRIDLSGPLCLFRDTIKYGRSIARFVPALLAAPTWSLRARVMLASRSAELRLESDGAPAFPSTIPAAPDGRLARRVARALRGVGVRVDLQPALARSGATLLVPDFALEWSSRRVLVDVVPFATPEYLTRKQEAIAALAIPMVVCVDERYASVEAPWLLPYRRELDPWVLLAAAQRLVGERGRSLGVPSEATAE